MTEEPITYRLDEFEGPLDLLLTLIEKNKMDIADIAIATICDQYMAYLAEAKKMDLDIACDFILMASTLMLIKSKMLLPRDPEKDEDPRKELADALALYKKAKEDAEELKPLYSEYSGRLSKDNDDIPPEKGFPLGLDPALLSRALLTMFNRLKVSEVPVTLINPLIKRRVVSVEEKITRIVDKLTVNEDATFFYLLKDEQDKSELIAAFMGILELIKLRRILFCDEEAEEFSITTRFRLNPDYVPDEDEGAAFSEFDEIEKPDDHDQQDKENTDADAE